MIRQSATSPVGSLGNLTTINDFLPHPKPDVQYFDEWKGELTHSQRHKADEFLNQDLIQYSTGGKFICLPIPGYNTRTYVMQRKDGSWICNCQGFVMKERAYASGLSPNLPFCSHLLALHHAFREKRFGGNHG
jgi:hypothetical protein